LIGSQDDRGTLQVSNEEKKATSDEPSGLCAQRNTLTATTDDHKADATGEKETEIRARRNGQAHRDDDVGIPPTLCDRPSQIHVATLAAPADCELQRKLGVETYEV
jgi:hypothetical protein